MKLRTVLGELGVTDYLAGGDVNFEEDVIVFPHLVPDVSFPEQVTIAPKDTAGPIEGFAGTTIVLCDGGLPETGERPPLRTVMVVSDLTRDEFEQMFEHLPAKHVELDLQRKRIYLAFQSSYDLQRYADKVYEILGNPLMIVNSDRRLLAWAGDFPEDRADVLEEITQGYISEEVNAELERDGILDDVRHAGHSIISANERFGQRWVTSIISFHHMEMGRFDMLEQNGTITDADLELVDFAGSLAGVMIDKLGIAGERAGSGSTVLDDLLGDTFANEKTMRAQLALSSMPVDDTYVLAELAADRELPRNHLQRIAARVSNAFRNSLWTMRNGRLVILIALGPRTCPGWDGYERTIRLLGQRKEFVTTLERNGMKAYVSEPFEQIALTRDRYQQIADLMAARVNDTASIVYFWQHRYSVLANMAQTFGQLDMMLDKRVVTMSLYDKDHGTAYLETAYRTVEHPGSPAEAAKALNVHRNTYFYRVNKILELFFIDLKKGEDRLSVAFFMHYLCGMDNQMMFDPSDMSLAWQRSVGRVS
ncbi:MAG: helix-turn-helix domain-containing protein [Atopobiaceae bacterium]|nr:helix-turn-helix domain-containing protein [Atopobiaceae bacterium]